MRTTLKRVLVILGAVAVVLGTTIGPAAAATTTITASWDASNGTTISLSNSSATVNNGDTLDFQYSSSDAASQFTVFSSDNGTCSGSPLGTVFAGGTVHETPSLATTGYDMRAVETDSGFASACATVAVTVANAPPPDVPEVPFAAGLLVAAGVIFGAGFFLLRRRATRMAA